MVKTVSSKNTLNTTSRQGTSATLVQITTAEAWRKQVTTNWQTFKKKAEEAKVETLYQELVIIALTPIAPKNEAQFKSMLKVMRQLRFTKPLISLFKKIYKDNNYTRTATDLARNLLAPSMLRADEKIGLDWILMATGTLQGITKDKRSSKKLAQTLLDGMKDKRQVPSAVRVQAGMISAGQNVVFAGQDVNIVSKHYHGNEAKLKAYLAAIRTDWNIPATSIHPASQHHVSTVLHQLYTPVDIWIDDSKFKSADNVKQLTERRFRAIEKDLNDARESVFEAIATNPLIVITGGAGTGKSSLCRFIATSLAYACDPDAEKRDKINGLELLGGAWIHGPMLPLYVSLRDFCNAKTIFPNTLKESTAETLLNYVKKTVGSFAPHLESYLTQTDVPTHGTLLVLDGLDEVYREEDRIILQRIIEKWADRFPTCRIIVTSRTYAYRKDARWHLSERFVSAELAPFSWKQMNTYVERWYSHAAKTRPGTLGGRSVAKKLSGAMAKDLKKSILENKSLWPLARHPLMLALLTLIHEDYKHLPSKRAELYEQTVELLDRWNIPLPTDKLHEKLSKINLERMRAALKMIAFDLQSQQSHRQRYPTTIQRGQLLEKLIQQQSYGEGLGASIEDVLEYLATRNGILVTDTRDLYRFPHLSVQEYLAACALIEYYDECKMPEGMKPSTSDGWMFPENIVALLCHDYSRWRNVALFAGSIIAADKGQDLRWQLIDELLPTELDGELPDHAVNSICIASEIWSESWLKPRKTAQRAIRDHLMKCLKAINKDERVDAPDHTNNRKVLTRLKSEQATA